MKNASEGAIAGRAKYSTFQNAKEPSDLDWVDFELEKEWISGPRKGTTEKGVLHLQRREIAKWEAMIGKARKPAGSNAEYIVKGLRRI